MPALRASAAASSGDMSGITTSLTPWRPITTMMTVADGVKPAPPAACSARNAMSVKMSSTSPQPTDATVNATTEPRKTRRGPFRSLNRPLIGSISTKPNE
jgi:hypothetical protein